MALLVQKFGGTSVADVERIQAVAQRIAASRQAGNDLVIVVSAMGHTTDELTGLARAISGDPPQREMDMLLSTGEQVSIALLAMALHAQGVPAVSMTGPQVGIVTESAHGRARILEVRTDRLQRLLGDGNVVVVAGFQGTSSGLSGLPEITTLGRGGSDTSAVALAAALGADACEIYSDVPGVLTTDPRKVPDAQLMDTITCNEMLELASLGAAVAARAADPDANVRQQAAYTLGEWPGPEAGAALAALLRADADRYIRAAAMSSALPHAEKLLAELSGGGPALEPLVAEIATATDNALAIAGLLARITAAASAADPRPVFDSLGALLDRLQRNNQTLAQLSAKGGEPMRLALEGTDTVLARARAIVAEVSAPTSDRTAAIGLLGRGRKGQDDDFNRLGGLLAASRAGGGRAALVDPHDAFDPDSFPADTLRHLVWVRCPNPNQAQQLQQVLALLQKL